MGKHTAQYSFQVLVMNSNTDRIGAAEDFGCKVGAAGLQLY
jgi:hypothetical protein